MFKMTKFIPVLLAAFFLWGGVSATNGQGRVTEILTRIDTHNKALSSLQADVTMAKYNSQLKITDITKGRTIYRPRSGKDALVRIDWAEPEESMAVVNKQYVIYRPRLNQYIQGKTDTAKGSAKSNNALAFLNMSRAQLRQNYDFAYINAGTLADGTKTDHIRLTPKTGGDYQYAEIWVDANGMPVQTKVVEKNNDTTTVLLTNIVKNKTIDASAFKIKIPSGAKKVEG